MLTKLASKCIDTTKRKNSAYSTTLTTRRFGRDFGNDQRAREHVKAVLRVMRNYVSEGELNHIKDQLPKPIAELFDE